MTEYIWNKPVVTIFRERSIPETEPFVVIKARKLIVNQTNNSLSGVIEDFFRLMGDVDYLTSPEGTNDKFVLCWFDDTIPEMTCDLRKLINVCFNGNIKLEIGQTGKRTYNTTFTAKHAKLK